MDYIVGYQTMHRKARVRVGDTVLIITTGRRELYRILGLTLRTHLKGSGRSLSLYGTSSYFLFNRTPYLADWATLFHLLVEGEISPVIAARFPILQAADALLESGRVTGNVVLVLRDLDTSP